MVAFSNGHGAPSERIGLQKYRAYIKAAAFDDPSPPVATGIDIKANYNAKYDALSAGGPKVFFKYFYVNTATGEKSGDVLAQAKLSE